MSIEFLKTDTTGGSSNLVLKDKSYYDFKAEFDVLLSDGGLVSINFRQKDNFNYYSFIIDKDNGMKILSKNINGNMEVIKVVNDGGITINQWHTVKIQAIGNKISVDMFDSENKKSTQKIMEAFDSSFIKGTMAFNVKGVSGFYFDNFAIEPQTCWSAWVPKDDLTIKNPNSNIYNEEFNGVFNDLYDVHELDESMVKDGPAIWSLKDGGTFEKNYILQENNAYDSTPKKVPNFVTLKDKHFVHGTFIVKFTPSEKQGIISVIFKYSNENKVERYYIFELNNERDIPSFDLKYINAGEIKSLRSKDATQINDFKKKAYIPNRLNFVKIDVINNRITISVSHDQRELIEVININSDSIMGGGAVGFGTYKTASKFSTISLSPPDLKMTPQDVNKVLVTSAARLFSTIPFPSAKKIEDVSLTVPGGKSATASALVTIKNQVTRFASSLGYNFKTTKATAPGEEKKSDNDRNSENEKKGEFKNNNDADDWKECVSKRSSPDRSSWCDSNYPSAFIKTKCEVRI